MKGLIKRGTALFLAVITLTVSFTSWILAVNATDATIGVIGRLYNGDPITGRVYYLRSSSSYLTVQNSGTADGTKVIKSVFTGEPNQEWMIVKASDAEDEYMLMDVNSGKFLSICASSPDDNATVWIWHNDGTSGQRFHIYNNGGGIYKLLTKTSNYSKAVGVDSSTGYGKQLPMSSAYTILYLEQASYTVGLNDGKTFLQNGASKHFLYGKINSLSYDYATQDSFSGQIPTCNFHYIGNNYYTISTVDDKYLTLFNNSPEEGDKIRLYNYTASDDKQIWKLVITSAGVYQFQPKLDTSGTLILCSQDEIDGSKLVLKNKNNVSGAYGSWHHITTDENFSTLGAHIVALEDKSHSTSHFAWMPEVLYSLYNKSSIYTRSKIFASENDSYDYTMLLQEMEKSNLFIFRGHGDYEYDDGELDTYMILNPKNSSGSFIGTKKSVSGWLIKSSVEEYVEDDTSDETENSALYNISGLNCAIFTCCHSAQEAYTTDGNAIFLDNNSMVSVFSYGGSNVSIGFDGTVSCDYADWFLRKLVEYYLIENSWTDAFVATLQNTTVGNNKPYLLTDTYGIYYYSNDLSKVRYVYEG